MRFDSMQLTGEQIRAARALVRIDQAELARRANLSLETIKRLERIRGPVDANARTLLAIHAAFDGLGIVLEHGEGGGVGVSRNPNGAPPRSSARPVAISGGAPAVSGDGAPFHRLLYSSRAKPAVASRLKATIDDIVEVASRRNEQLEVSGALFACGGCFLQVLEGPKGAVQQIYGAISSDPRHEDIKVLESRTISGRQFQDWTMCCGLFQSDEDLVEHEPALKGGFRPELLTATSGLGLLSIVRDLQALPPRSARGGRGDCPLAAECLDRICAASAVNHSAGEAAS